MQLKIVTLSKPGGRRANEDACGYCTVEDISCCILSDGLGGHDGGATASKLSVEHVLEAFRKTPQCSIDGIKSLMDAGSDAVLNEQIKNPRLNSMRTTAVILTIDSKQKKACWGNIGDSRLYCFRNGRIIKQTKDHSVSQMMVDAGYLKQEMIRSAPGRNQLYAAMGDKNHFEFETVSVPFPICDGDAFLLCSDGLWEYVEENVMERLLQKANSANSWLTMLEQQVLQRGGVGQDNYSAIVVWCGNSDEDTTQITFKT
ncbi:PP2C family serine/threonine-protein phosphatase [Nitrosomonas sp.]|uniref:PP2C family protein-serine/threonine phosphatase n=1 Tax=Nitrosomonas sp. TaxID=42353 RepID=UPI001D730E31|nr:protein phosphatase 2C domain-containing protein [Nitrosomonas sp.]MCB1949953.1 serine/threonine-protein phosphatase [Nitrosomonas sp.]MDR4515594.1 protein phosphatase 2C domain-containing protein [Nitrosomonas sp.]